MGLTIHYRFQTGGDVSKARKLVAELRRRALDLPFQHVGDVVELDGDQCNSDVSENQELRWLLIQARAYLMKRDFHYSVTPTHLIAFGTSPGDGCEDANFGLCAYPKTIKVLGSSKTTFPTQKQGWSWGSFCKTQYASNPDCGGLPNFLRCHLLVVKMLDAAHELGILQDVRDEGEFWKKRDALALAREVDSWNSMIGAIAGQLKDLHGEALEAAILKFPNFEHLEAKGQTAMKKRDAGKQDHK
jgi:hypothetical protein